MLWLAAFTRAEEVSPLRAHADGQFSRVISLRQVIPVRCAQFTFGLSSAEVLFEG